MIFRLNFKTFFKDLLDRAGEMPVFLIFNISNVYEIVAYDWLYSQGWGRVKMADMALKFLGNIEAVFVNLSRRA